MDTNVQITDYESDASDDGAVPLKAPADLALTFMQQVRDCLNPRGRTTRIGILLFFIHISGLLESC